MDKPNSHAVAHNTNGIKASCCENCSVLDSLVHNLTSELKYTNVVIKFLEEAINFTMMGTTWLVNKCNSKVSVNV